jgi:subtilase family serine protease
MFRSFGIIHAFCLVVGVSLLALPGALLAQPASTGRNAPGLIAGRIDETRLHAIAGNTRPEANPQNDRGLVPEDLAMDHALLQLQRSAAQEQAVQQFVESLQDPASPNFHKWLTAAEFGERFGAAQPDLDAIAAWLQSHGLTVNSVYPNGMLIDFSGTAGQIRAAFHTEIHYLQVNGQTHLANMSDPRIPEALAPVVAGVVSLHDFRPRTMSKRRPDYTFVSGKDTYQAVVPADLATIYNLNPLFKAGIAGQGQTIVVVEDTDLYSATDWTTFRSEFGLSSYTTGSLATVHPAPATGKNNCTDPGVPSGGDDGEAILDAEWASAAAPGAAIEVASCRDTTTFGGLIAIQNLVNSGNPPAIVSMSYGECEAVNGAAANAAFNTAFQQAAAEGVSVFVSAGDEGAASCDAEASGATHGIGVSGFASTPYNVAVGGTDFGDSYAGSNSAYWSSANTPAYGSAKSYIPEIPWNDSCASVLLATYLGDSTTYGAKGFCNSSTAISDGLQVVAAGSGGPSGCASGAPSTPGVVGGTCKAYAKPSWQSGLAKLNLAPNDGVRDIPDVSLFAANGIWGHYYVFCWSDIREGGARCSGAPSGWSGAGGTSFSSPILAGIQALVNQHAKSPQGNPNTVYYKLAATGSCNSSTANATGNSCIFYNVTQGDNDVNCGGSVDCYGSTTSTSGGRHPTTTQNLDGALSTSSGSYSPAYGAAAGWNFATGIGSVNAYNLVMGW